MRVHQAALHADPWCLWAWGHRGRKAVDGNAVRMGCESPLPPGLPLNATKKAYRAVCYAFDS
jgi:hypothetical protein